MVNTFWTTETEVICDGTSMTLLMDKSLLDDGGTASDVHFIDESCVGYDHDSHRIVITTSYNRCGTKQTVCLIFLNFPKTLINEDRKSGMRNSKNSYDPFSMFGCNDVEVGAGGKITLFSGSNHILLVMSISSVSATSNIVV